MSPPSPTAVQHIAEATWANGFSTSNPHCHKHDFIFRPTMCQLHSGPSLALLYTHTIIDGHPPVLRLQDSAHTRSGWSWAHSDCRNNGFIRVSDLIFFPFHFLSAAKVYAPTLHVAPADPAARCESVLLTRPTGRGLGYRPSPSLDPRYRAHRRRSIPPSCESAAVQRPTQQDSTNYPSLYKRGTPPMKRFNSIDSPSRGPSHRVATCRAGETVFGRNSKPCGKVEQSIDI